MIWFFCIRTVNFSGFIVCLSGWQCILGGLQTKICAVKAFDFKSKSLAPSVQPSVSHDKSAYLKQLSLVKEARAKHDIKLLTKRLKTIAIIFRGKVQLDDLLPIYENITATKRTSNADVCDLMWNTGRLGISGTKGKHRSACMNLLNLFLGAQNLTTTEVSNGLVAMTTLGLEFSKLSYDTRAKMQDIVTERLLNYVEDDGVSQIVCRFARIHSSHSVKTSPKFICIRCI